MTGGFLCLIGSCQAEILALEPDQIKLPKERTARQQIKKWVSICVSSWYAIAYCKSFVWTVTSSDCYQYIIMWDTCVVNI